MLRCAQASLGEMIAPGALVMLTPLVVGILFGTRTLSGILAGALVSGVQMAVSMSNTGGAWDNAKKYVEVSSMILISGLTAELLTRQLITAPMLRVQVVESESFYGAMVGLQRAGAPRCPCTESPELQRVLLWEGVLKPGQAAREQALRGCNC